MKQYNGNSLSFHSNNCGNIVSTTQNDGITIEWQQITAVKSFITPAAANNGTKLITTVKKFTGRAPEQEVEEKLSQHLKRKRDKRYRKQKCFAD
jgi:hypothetical protein